MIGTYCRLYRISRGVKLRTIEGSTDVQLLSAFEMGRSSNVKHFMKYLNYAISIDDVDGFLEFIRGL